MKIEGDTVTFLTGKTLSVNLGIIGIGIDGDGDLWPSGGYDDGFACYEKDWEDDGLTTAECVEMADFMLQRWGEFRKKYAGAGLDIPPDGFSQALMYNIATKQEDPQ